MSGGGSSRGKLVVLAASMMWTADELRLWAKGEPSKVAPSILFPERTPPAKHLDELERFVGLARELLAKED